MIVGSFIALALSVFALGSAIYLDRKSRRTIAFLRQYHPAFGQGGTLIVNGITVAQFRPVFLPPDGTTHVEFIAEVDDDDNVYLYSVEATTVTADES